MTNLTDALQAMLYRDIPLSKTMEIRVQSWDERELRFSLPLQPNVNHLQSAFGGSLYCATVIAGWSWLYLMIDSMEILNAHIVIQKAEIEYPQPVLGDSIVICSPPSLREWNRFETIFHRYGKARISLQSFVLYKAEIAVIFKGDFVVYRDPATVES